MNKTLRILSIEDSEDDALLLRQHLARADLELAFERVDTLALMKAALEDREWDIILADYSMPSFGALQALALLSEMGLDTPLIVISGTIGEEIAVKTMLAGARDYLMKDKLTRLLPAIERELQEAESRRARHRAERALFESEDRYRDLVEHSHDLICTHDLCGRILSFNEAAVRLLGYEQNVLLEKNMRDVLFLGARQEFDTYIADLESAGIARGVAHVETRLGEERIWEYTNTLRTQGVSNPIVRGMARDVTDRRRAEDEEARLGSQLERQRRRLNNIVASVPGVVWEAWGEPDAATQRINFVSDYVEKMLGYSQDEWLSTTNFWLSIVHPDDRAQAARTAAANFSSGKSTSVMQFRWVAKDGRVLWVESNAAIIADDEGHPVGLRGVTIDVSERKRVEQALQISEEQLQQSQKLEAIGVLAGGIAHDFNNLLTVIGGYSGIALKRLKSDESVRNCVEEIKRAGERAASLTRQLLAFSRRQVLQPRVIVLNSVISEMARMLQRLIGEDIELRMVLDPTLGNVKADPGQIEQVIMNLVVNSRDAMPDGGKLTIETANVFLNGEHLTQNVSVTAGNYIMIAVSDTGTGIDSETLPHIFEPFFTTKAVGQGTGLGLPTVYGIVKQSGGDICVYSEIGGGTTFRIYLLRVDEEPPEGTAAGDPPKARHGTETVLLAEDEEMVRKLIVEVLMEEGYNVLEAANGRIALQLSQSYGETIHLLVTDVVMPELGGRDLVDQLTQNRPAIKVLYISGYTDDTIIRHRILDSGIPYLQKPFTGDALSDKVHDILGRS